MEVSVGQSVQKNVAVQNMAVYVAGWGNWSENTASFLRLDSLI